MTDLYVGPLGALQPLPDVQGGTDVTLTRVGGSHTSLYGARRNDTFGYRRSWAWTRDGLTPRQVAYVDALVQNLVPGPLRLVDTRAPNRLNPQVATAGSLLGSVEGFDTTGGVVYYEALPVAPADPATLPAAPIHRGAIAWQITQPGTVICYPTTPRGLPCPVLPGEDTDVSMWVTGPSGTTAAVGWVETYRDGGTASRVGASRSITPGVWTKLSGTVPAAAALAGVLPQLVVTASAQVVVHTAAWHTGSVGSLEQQLPPRMVTCDEDGPDPYDGWRPGGGSPRVVVDPGSRTYLPYGLHTAGLTLTEA